MPLVDLNRCQIISMSTGGWTAIPYYLSDNPEIIDDSV